MKAEIKEILDNMKEISSFEYTTDWFELNYEDTKILLDYITNLQEKIDQYENPDDLTLFYMWLDEKAKDKMKNLQEENQRLKELCDKYEEEHSTAFNLWKMKMEEMPTYEEKEDYKSRIDKAIKKINKMFADGNEDTVIDDLLELEKILQGEDK